MNWTPYLLPLTFDFPPDAKVLDIGCGTGEQLAESPGSFKVGIEPHPDFIAACHSKGFGAIQAKAEHLPFADESFDGVICKVVLAFTLEDTAINEISRVLHPKGKCYLITNGSGYYLKYLLTGSLKHRFYGLRAIINTWFWKLTHKRLPGFVGDTIYASPPRLARHIRHSRLIVAKERASTFLSFPVFIYHEIAKAYPRRLGNQ